MNEAKERQAEYFNFTDNWEIRYTGSDVSLLMKLKELQEEGNPFVYISWSPGLQTADLQALPINFPYNPSSSQRDDCVREGSCTFSFQKFFQRSVILVAYLPNFRKR